MAPPPPPKPRPQQSGARGDEPRSVAAGLSRAPAISVTSPTPVHPKVNRRQWRNTQQPGCKTPVNAAEIDEQCVKQENVDVKDAELDLGAGQGMILGFWLHEVWFPHQEARHHGRETKKAELDHREAPERRSTPSGSRRDGARVDRCGKGVLAGSNESSRCGMHQ